MLFESEIGVQKRGTVRCYKVTYTRAGWLGAEQSSSFYGGHFERASQAKRGGSTMRERTNNRAQSDDKSQCNDFRPGNNEPTSSPAS